MTPQIPFLRRFGASVTALTDRYKGDPVFRVTTQVVLLQVVLTAILIVVLVGTYDYLEATVRSVIMAQAQALNGPGGLDAAITISRERRVGIFVFVFVIVFLLTTFFTAIIANFALNPSRSTLSFQKRFIGNVAHEIRTPLAIIKTSTEVALFDPTLPQDIRETLEQTISELDRISETINNLLSFDSLTRPKVMQFEPVNLADIAKTVCDRHQDLAESRGITLSCTGVENALVNGNATALDQVITNLAKNALNYTPADKNGQVTVEVDRALSGGYSVSVIDTGIGIMQKDLYHIFEPFYRADTSRARGIGTGTSGLGLAIVNEIVRLHHGTITLRSAVGHGTTIKVTFPPYRDTRQPLPLMAPSGSPHEATLDFSKKSPDA